MQRNHNIIALAAALLYLLLWVGLMLWVKFPVRDQAPVELAIMIDFGQDEPAGGEQDTPPTEDVAEQPMPTEATPDAPSEISPAGDVPVEQVPVEQPRRADPRSLFPGRTAGSASTSQGASQGEGNQGSAAGMPDGTSYALAGRSIVGTLPKPAYRSSREGRVVVEIVVDPSGMVVGAAYRATGSTGVDSRMIEDALAAARKARFTEADTQNNQSGTIVYLFRIN